MINVRAAARLGIGYGARQMAALGLSLVDSIALPAQPASRHGGPLLMERHPLHIKRARQREEDALVLLLLS